MPDRSLRPRARPLLERPALLLSDVHDELEHHLRQRVQPGRDRSGDLGAARRAGVPRLADAGLR